MDFADALKEFSKKVESLKDKISTEEATKTALIMPFFQLLGYDVFNPMEFVPEYSAELGLKKSEKVDYAIMKNGEPLILVEAKSINERLNKHSSQLFKYFAATSSKLAILTNGVSYRIYTDLDEVNKMDTSPFLEFNLLKLRDIQIQDIRKFHKSSFDIDSISSAAFELKNENDIKAMLQIQMQNPSDSFVRFILSEGIYTGVKTQSVIEKYRDIVRKAFNQFVNDSASERLETALNQHASVEDKEITANNEVVSNLTDRERDVYETVLEILSPDIPDKRMGYKKAGRYFSVILDGNVKKWVCRIFVREKVNELTIRKIEGLNFETEYEFTSPSQLLSIDDLLRQTALKIP